MIATNKKYKLANASDLNGWIRMIYEKKLGKSCRTKTIYYFFFGFYFYLKKAAFS